MNVPICDICGTRPATARVTMVRNGQERIIDVCSVDYAKLQQRMASPFESLFLGDIIPGSVSQSDTEQSRNREGADITEHLSDSAKRVIQESADVAAKFGRSEIDTEHLLYSLTNNDIVERILSTFKIKPDDVRGYIDANTIKEAHKTETFGVSPRVKRALGNAVQASHELGHGYVGPEHLLIGLAEEEDGMAGDMLRKFGLSSQSLRQKTLGVVGKGAKDGKVEGGTETPHLDKYSRDLSAMARQGKLDPVIGRAPEIETTIEILSRRTKNNPVLIGEPGVGKTAIVEGLAQRIVANEVPESLHGKRVLELSLNSVVAGTKFRGEFEERIKNVLDEIAAHKDELVLFVDELHTLIGAGSGGGEGGLDASNIIKPALSRGDLHLIGATTLNEYQKYIEKDAALERRFQPVLVAEPTPEQSIEILRGLRDRYEAHHRVKITDEAITAAVDLSDRYITTRFLPDKAIDLIDQAGSRVRIAASSHSKEYKQLDDRISALKREHESATTHREYDRAKELEAQCVALTEERDREEERWRKERGVTSSEVTVRHIAEVVSKLTGVPVTELTQEEKEKLLKLEQRLSERVIGQEEAITAVSNAVRISRAGFAEKNKPIATFMFLGPTGVGKTELAKSLAWTVFGDESAMIRIDMSEYMERHAVSRLIGAPPGYVGYDEGGQLTEPVRRRPYTVILLDEIEKAHPDAYNLLLQLFDDGRLTDGKGRVVDFSNTIIIATSNLGSELYGEVSKIGFKAASHGEHEKSVMRDDMMRVLRQHFRPEFINRLDEIIIFHPLSKEQIEKIVQLQLERVARTAHGQGITLHFEPSLVQHLAEVGYMPEFGARELRRRIKLEVENVLAKEVLEGKLQEGSEVPVKYTEKQGVQFAK
jgi:ATP-dependent Clp protease ATP-binding subunit ClpC